MASSTVTRTSAALLPQPTRGRRPAVPRLPKGQHTRDQILSVAAQLASTEGLEGLTLGRLAAAVGMSKSGLFAHFRSKEELQLAVVDTAKAMFIEEVIRPAENAVGGFNRLRKLAESWLSYAERKVFRGGCFFTAASLEFDNRPGVVRERITAIMNQWMGLLESEIRRAQAEKQLSPRVKAEQLAFEFNAQMMGANWAYQLLHDHKAFAKAKAAILERLESFATARGARHAGKLALVFLLLGSAFPSRAQQAPPALPPAPSQDEVPIERCDGLPVIRVRIDAAEMRFLVDTAATTTLNLKSFSAGESKRVKVTSWSGTAATSAREVSVPELAVGTHRLENLKLPAIDLSPIGKACGGRIDGILGVDVLDKLGVTINLKRQVAQVDGTPADARARYDEMEASMAHCNDAFDLGKADALEECFDPEIILYTPMGEFRGRKQVMEFLKEHYLQFAPHIHYEMKPRDIQGLGDAMWYSYDYTIASPSKSVAGHGMAVCRRSGGRWRILNMHNSLLEPEASAKPLSE